MARKRKQEGHRRTKRLVILSTTLRIGVSRAAASSQDAQKIEDGSVKVKRKSQRIFEKALDIDKKSRSIDESDVQKRTESKISRKLWLKFRRPVVSKRLRVICRSWKMWNDESGGVLDEAKDFEKDKDDLLYADSHNNGFDEGSAVVEENIEVATMINKLMGLCFRLPVLTIDNSLMEVVQEDNEDDLLPRIIRRRRVRRQNRAEGDFEELIQEISKNFMEVCFQENEDDLIQRSSRMSKSLRTKFAMEDFPREFKSRSAPMKLLRRRKTLVRKSKTMTPMLLMTIRVMCKDGRCEQRLWRCSCDAKEIENVKDDLLQYEAQNGGLEEGLAVVGGRRRRVHNEQEIQEELIQPNGQDAEVVVVKEISYVVENASGAKLKRDWREENL
uniref:Uncharacterized protein n=1 Tax=Ditylenchus dipsaci TaxID=166011 RepID=A0A915E5R9_9BILA